MEEATQTKIEAPTTSENATNEGSAFVEAPSSSKNAPNEDNVSIETQYLIAKQNRSAFVGPLPPPEILSKYEDAFPGSAERIFKMAENQADHRRNMEKESLKLASRDSLLGIITGFIIATAGIFAVLTLNCGYGRMRYAVFRFMFARYYLYHLVSHFDF